MHDTEPSSNRGNINIGHATNKKVSLSDDYIRGIGD